MGLPSHPAMALPMSGLSWLAVETISSLPPLTTSHAQPEPKRPMPAASNFAWKSAKEPKAALMAVARSPEGVPPLPGPIRFQKKVWFQWPPPLLRTGPRMASGTPARFPIRASSESVSTGVPAMALLRLST